MLRFNFNKASDSIDFAFKPQRISLPPASQYPMLIISYRFGRSAGVDARVHQAGDRITPHYPLALS